MTESIYLKPNVITEPLINGWYAWSYLLSPHHLAMCTANKQLKIMESFIKAPLIHQNAVKNPALIGGPFMDHPTESADEVTQLIEHTRHQYQHLIKLAEDIKTADQMLEQNAKGQGLREFYTQLPESLRGFVELVYDTNHQASIRFIEALLYQSHYYCPQAQTLAFSIHDCDKRSFTLSTPRLESDEQFHLSIPFADPMLDELFKMRRTPGNVDKLKYYFDLSSDETFDSFFTSTPPKRNGTRYQGSGVRIRYFGHACILIETNEVSLLTDPLISYFSDVEPERYSLEDLPEFIDYVLITHNHQDHVIFETLLQIRHQVGQVLIPKNNGGYLGDPSLKLIFKHLGFKNIVEMDEMDQLNIQNGCIHSLPFLGEHGDLNIRAKSAFWVELKGKKFLLAADSNNIDPTLYKHIYQHLGDVDLIFLGMESEGAPISWLCGPLFTRTLSRAHDESRRLDGCNFERALAMVEQFNPQHVYVYAMGGEPWLGHMMGLEYEDDSPQLIESNKLVGACREKGITADRPYCKMELELELVPA